MANNVLLFCLKLFLLLKHNNNDDGKTHYSIGADSTGATGNFALVLTQEPGQTLRFAPVPFMAVL